MKVLKFGGSSLAKGQSLQSVLEIIEKENQNDSIAIVVSARGKATDQLIELYELASSAQEYKEQLNHFWEDQYLIGIDTSLIKTELQELLEAIALLKINNLLLRDKVLAFGEVLSAQSIVQLLKRLSIKAVFKDARELIKITEVSADLDIDLPVSKKLTQEFFNELGKGEVAVITGFLASDEFGNTITLGRNGSNYTASLVASFIQASEVQNWTDVSGIYSASPQWVKNAKHIPHLSYKEANELANFGVNVLHAKTILPLVEESIPLRIFNTRFPENGGTLIDEEGSGKGIKAVSTIQDVALVSIAGRGLLGKVGIDARIFSVLSKNNIGVRLISQASSERGIGFIIDKECSAFALLVLKEEFKRELQSNDISSITSNEDMAIIAIVGRHNYALEKAIHGLRRNKIWMHLISNSISGEHISLVINNRELKKAVNVVHNHVFGAIKIVNLFAFGKGTVGGKLIDQIINTPQEKVDRRKLQINVVGIADSQKIIFNEEGFSKDWRLKLQTSSTKTDITEIIKQLKESALENIVIADNTASIELTKCYPDLIKAGFDLVASNKKANSISYPFYQELRSELNRRGRLFFYETNVGAGLPLIDTLKNLYNSSDEVKRIRGVFSGSLSYVFNNYSVQEIPFFEVLEKARTNGLTEPDPREDLGGADVARKLIILAREVGLTSEFDEVEIENLIPEELRSIEEYSEFEKQEAFLNSHFSKLKSQLKENEVLRYVGDLDVEKAKLQVSLVKTEINSPLGNIKNADSLFEIYTEGYGEQPIIIQGAGAGAEVTAGGVYSDLLRIGSLS